MKSVKSNSKLAKLKHELLQTEILPPEQIVLPDSDAFGKKKVSRFTVHTASDA